MIKRLMASGHNGFYFSVVEPGEASAGSRVEFVSRDPARITVADILSLTRSRSADQDLLKRATKVSALPESWKEYLLEKAQRRER
jgi:MOSC domain-containing protein YiiM